MAHAFVTIVLPLPARSTEAVAAALEALGNPIGETADTGGTAQQDVDLKAALDAAAMVHFMAGAIAPGEPGEPDHLVFEISADGERDGVLALFDPTGKSGQALAPVLAAAGVTGDPVAAMARRMLTTGSGLRSLPGLDFTGSPGMTVRRILQEARLADAVRERIGEPDALGADAPGAAYMTALERLEWLRRDIRGNRTLDEEARGLIEQAEPVPMLAGQKITGLSAGLAARLFAGATRHLLWPLIWLAAAIAAYRSLPYLFHEGHHHLGHAGAWLAAIWSFVWRTAFWAALFVAAAWISIAATLRYRERGEEPDDSMPDLHRLDAIRRREDRQGLQNHLFGVSRMKPGPLRRLLLRFAFWIITYAATNVFRPGHLKDIGTIHFARWFMLPGTRTLIFCSNYGGSWESYLEDFITKAPNGLTAVWSNTIGFPRARFLFGDGARQSDPFKRWARRQQHPTLLWYSAYPSLSTDRIRINAAIRNALASAVTEDEARAFLSLLGSRPAPAETLEKDEIQTLMLSGMSHYKQSVIHVLKLPPEPMDARRWLAGQIGHVGHGERPGGTRVDQIAFTASGLSRFLDDAVIGDFPFAFRAGMAARAAALGDIRDDAPECWEWGAAAEDTHVLLITYLADEPPPDNPEEDVRQHGYGAKHRPPQPPSAEEKRTALRERARRISDEIAASLKPLGGDVQAAIVTVHLDDKERTPEGAPHAREFFGFADGVSQPRIRGLRPYRLIDDDQHILAPGEFVLGYPDNRGQRAFAARVPAMNDPDQLLPVAGADHGRAIEPDLARSGINAPRDIGRNGSYLVVRQLAQSTTDFEHAIGEAAMALARHPGMPATLIDDPTLPQSERDLIAARRRHYIAAKMVGRWRDGSSLVAFPNEPRSGWGDEPRMAGGGDPPARPQHRGDNGFLFGRDDPGGLACPYGSHIRRANPRDSLKPNAPAQIDISNRHRILRRGRFFKAADSVGLDRNDGREEGLMFICANADIERQFEFIQQTWMMAPQFHGLHDEVDPLFARGAARATKKGPDAGHDRGESPYRFTIPTECGPMVVRNLRDCVRVVGGGYFFLPSKAALRFMARTAPTGGQQ